MGIKMILCTSSEVVSLARKFETESAESFKMVYNSLRKETIFLDLAQENINNITQIERIYYSGISDALEGCFSFKIEPAQYILSPIVTENVKFADILATLLENEKNIIRFYNKAAEQAQGLMVDMSRIFKTVASKREKRLSLLAGLQTN